MSARRCTAKSKTGKPCEAHPMTDRATCIAHADKAERDSTGFGITGGRPRKPRMVDLIRERMEADLDAWYRVLDDARSATTGVTIKLADGETEFFSTPDHATRLAAFREANDRAYGKSRQAIEHTGAGGGPITQVTLPTDTDRAQEIAAILKEAGAVEPAQKPVETANGNGRRGNGNGNGRH